MADSTRPSGSWLSAAQSGTGQSGKGQSGAGRSGAGRSGEDPSSTSGPEGATAGSGGEREPARELDRLRELLVGDERRALDELRRRLDAQELTPEELAELLPDAVGLRTGQDDKLTRALSPTLEAAIAESVQRNPQRIAHAIYPTLGPAIRRAISEALSGLVETVNRAIEHSFSWRGLKWRFEAMRAGVPFAEIVLKHALVYRVEEAFLIEAESGLPLGHVALDEARTEDPDLVSGMLTAIQDFVADSFETSSEAGLSRFKVGELTVHVESGPRATLAAVVRGQEPGDLVARMQAALETIHLRFRAQLARFDGDATSLEPAEPILAALLETVVATDRPESRSLAPRIVWGVIGATILILAYLGVRSQLAWRGAVRALRAEPGLTLLEADRSFSEWRFQGLKDPLARDPVEVLADRGVDRSGVAGNWKSYLSFDPEMILARAREALDPPDGVELALENETLVASGAASARWTATVRDRGAALLGISGIDLSGLAVRLPAALAAEGNEIVGRRVLFEVGSARLQPGERAALDDLARRILRLVEKAANVRYRVRVRLIGRTDSSGSEESNRALSEQRARSVEAALTQRGIEPQTISIAGIGATDPVPASDAAESARINRSVSFEVDFDEPES